MVMESDFAFAFNDPAFSIVFSVSKRIRKNSNNVLNAGGPDRLSRVQMAEAVAEVRGHDMSLIKQVSASSVDRGVVSPADISMDITKLVQTLDISPTSFKDGVRLTLESESQYFPNFRDTQLQLSVSM